MIKTFKFYFDFGSPYAYLAHKEIKKIENIYKIKIKYMPVFLGGLHKILGIEAPASIPLKAKFMIRDCKLWAEKNKINFKFNTYFPIISLNLMRGVIFSEKEKLDSIYIDKFILTVWIKYQMLLFN